MNGTHKIQATLQKIFRTEACFVFTLTTASTEFLVDA